MIGRANGRFKPPSSPPDQRDPTPVTCVKCVLVGDGAVGKTSLIVSYTTNGFPQEYSPTAFDNYNVIVKINEEPVKLQICDTAGQEDFDAIRPLCYPGTTVFLLCFSVVCPTSFLNLQRRWLPEITQSCPKVPVILVGTQCDRRTNMTVLLELRARKEVPVSPQDIKNMVRKVNALQYIECSALTQKNLKEVFDAALMAALNIATGPTVVPPLHHFQSLRQKVTRALSLDSIHHSSLRVHRNSASSHSVFNAKYSTNITTKKLPVGHLITDGATKIVDHDLQKKHKLRRGWRRMLCMS